ncbi:hypothetical protein A9Q83_04845 [Alphaproteobacteria bacterium 46_93_T64]|nr:hypothetical protein A9Q83_04845 [Alphaproteobacteria bacterium 46_93_T64]
MNFNGKVAAITGAGSGIGRALAVRLAEEGCSVSLADVDQKGLTQTAAEVAKLNVGCKQTHLDVRDKKAVGDWADETVQEFGRVDYIFNNAGVTLFDSAASTEYDDFEWVMDINFWGMVYGTKSFMKYFQEVKTGHVINVSSLFGLVAFPNQSAYNASKFAIRGFTEALALEMKDTDIQVSSVHPGGILTDIARNSRFKETGSAGVTKEEAVRSFDAIAKTAPAQAADVILKGVLAGKRRILVGTDAKIIDFLQRLMPVRYASLLLKVLKP